MKMLVIVSEFPKLTETFAYRNLIEYMRLGHDPWLFHIKPFRSAETMHGFMAPLVSRVFTLSFAGPGTLGQVFAEWLRNPLRMTRLTARLCAAHCRHPGRALAVAALYPKSVALGRWCKENGIQHIHAEFAGHPASSAMIASVVSGVPFSFTAHANDIFVSQAMLADKAKAARFVRAISRYNTRFLTELPEFPAHKLRLIRCGVPRVITTAPVPGPPDAKGLSILYVGSLTEKKGVAHLLDALAMLPRDMPWTARIVGGGALLGMLQAQAQRLGLCNRVAFDGPLPAEAVAEAQAGAHVIVVPSVAGPGGRVEGIPVVLMEAMGHGRVVVASALSGIPELVKDGKTGFLVPPGKPRAIANALCRIADDWPAAACMAGRGQAQIRADYVIERNARDLAATIMETSQ
ncbi:MAG: glycosyltransferase family 4 protein [Pseudomonadota bacterium]